MVDIRNTIEMYNEKINNYKFEYAEEFSLEKIINVYKSHFDKKSIAIILGTIYEAIPNFWNYFFHFLLDI